MKTAKKMLLCAAVAATLVTGCSKKQQYVLSGQIDDIVFDDCMAYLYNGKQLVDSTVIKDGRFTFSGTVSEPWIGTVISTVDNGRSSIDLIVEPGEMSFDLLGNNVGGTPSNDSLQKFNTTTRAIAMEFEPQLRGYLQLYYSATDAATRSLNEHRYDSVEALAIRQTFEEAMKTYRNNADNLVGAYAMGVVVSTDSLDYNQMQEILKTASPKVKEYRPVAEKMEQLRCLEQTSVGKHYTDVVGVDGKLSDLIDGKLALVDFYASWCGPCRAEIRDNLVPLWAKYKDKGLVIVGLNVWERGDREAREAAHRKVMDDLGITYPQLVDSTRTATTTYGVQGIPQIMLIGSDGTILARDLRGAAIEEAIIKAL